MAAQPTEITGAETLLGDGGALDALIQFYKGFNARDLNALEANWAPGNIPSMSNPIGGIRRGWPSIREGYRKLFEGKAIVQVAFYDFTSQGGSDWHVFAGREKGTCKTAQASMELRIRTTRWFTKVDNVWRQLHHHGSIEEPAMLAEYQTLIFGAPLTKPG